MDLKSEGTEGLLFMARKGGESGRSAISELKRRRDNGSSYAEAALEELANAETQTRQDVKGCRKCGPLACGEGHLYVIELEPQAATDAAMIGVNPSAVPGSTPLYVGSTFHTVECNYNNGHLGEKGETYWCRCFGEEKERECIIRPSTYYRYTVRRLRYDLFSGINPVPKETVKSEEEALAEVLRRLGFMVWQK